MIVINFPYYVTVKETVDKILASRDKISNATNLYVSYGDSTVHPTQYVKDGILYENTGDDDKWFPLNQSNETNPREVFFESSDTWRLDKRNYIMIDRANPQNSEELLGGNNVFVYDDGLNIYKYRIDDQTLLKIKTNVISNDGSSSAVIGTSLSEMSVVDLSKYMIVRPEDITAAGKDPASYQTFVTPATIPTPIDLVYTKLDDVTGNRQIKRGQNLQISYSQFKDDNGTPICKSETIEAGKYVYHWALCGSVPTSVSGILAHHALTVNNNIMYQLLYRTRYNDVDPATTYEWDYAQFTLSKMDVFDYSDVKVDGTCTTPANIEMNDPVVYVVHKDVADDGTIITVGSTRLGFINQTTQVVIGHKSKVINEATVHAFDEIYVVGGSTSSWVDFGLVDVKYFTSKDKFDTAMA